MAEQARVFAGGAPSPPFKYTPCLQHWMACDALCRQLRKTCNACMWVPTSLSWSSGPVCRIQTKSMCVAATRTRPAERDQQQQYGSSATHEHSLP